MGDDENINSVSQNNNTIETGDIAGRDIYKNTYQKGNIVNIYLAGQQDYQSLIQLLQKITGTPEKIIRKVIKEGEQERYGREALEKSLSLLDITKNSLVSDVFSDIKGEYESIVLGNFKDNLDEEYLKGIIKVAAVHIKKMEFYKAHQHFGNALSEMNSNEKTYNLILKEYLITGFIHYSRQNDMDGLKSLLRKKKASVQEDDPSIDYVIANIFQEVCSRDTDLVSLQKAVAIVEKIYRSAPIVVKPLMANSLGLAYRRLGERTKIEYLEKAVSTFKEGLSLNSSDKTLEVQLKDQMAITLVRIFEFTLKEEYLKQAEHLLHECLETLKTIFDPRDVMLKPRVLNNIGNVFKQRVLVFDDFTSASKAISYYEEAEKTWVENDSGYEWGLLKKNIGETKFALGSIINDPELLIEAMEDCIAAMKYRDLKNSPYQWAKSVEIIFSIVISLKKQNAISKVIPATRKKIVSYAKAVGLNAGKWQSNNFPHFVENAVKAAEYLG